MVKKKIIKCVNVYVKLENGKFLLKINLFLILFWYVVIEFF